MKIEISKAQLRDIIELINTEINWNKNWKEYYPTLSDFRDKFV